MSEMEVISLQTGCKGAYGCVGFFGGARLLKDLESRPEFNVFRHQRSMLGQNACRAAAVVWQLQAGTRYRLTARPLLVVAMLQHLPNQRLRESPSVFRSLAPPKITLDPLPYFFETLKVLGVSISREQGGGYTPYRLGSTKRDSTGTLWTVGCCRTGRFYA
jgi:hypothetical protein